MVTLSRFYKSKERAISAALKVAKRQNKSMFVVWVPDHQAYDIATEFDVDTFYDGYEIVFCTDDAR